MSEDTHTRHINSRCTRPFSIMDVGKSVVLDECPSINFRRDNLMNRDAKSNRVVESSNIVDVVAMDVQSIDGV